MAGFAIKVANIYMGQDVLERIGRYEIISILGRGATSEVILAQDENLRRKVAIRRPLVGRVAGFQMDPRAATLRHLNIPAVYEIGVHEGLPFVAMEYVEGETLAGIIESQRELDLIAKLRIIEQVCSALGYAHKNGVIHHDIRPAKIIVQPDGVPKIIGFGFGPIQDGQPGSAAEAGKIDGRADIFSAGVMLFKLLTGKEPFTGTEIAGFAAHTALGAFLHDYPPALNEITAKSLARNPDHRYQAAEEFAGALHHVIQRLKRARVIELLSDAERLKAEHRFDPALKLLDEAARLDPSNTDVRKLRKWMREHQEGIQRAQRVGECLRKSEEALLAGNFDEALAQLRDARTLEPADEEIQNRIDLAEEKKYRFESNARALEEAERVRSLGDLTGALRIVTEALHQDSENPKLASLKTALAQQVEIEKQRDKLFELQENAAHALAVRDYGAAARLLNDAVGIDASNAETDKLREELAKARQLEQHLALLEEIQLQVQECLRNDDYDRAAELVDRALGDLPGEILLHRLRAEVDAGARQYDVRRIVDLAISQAKDLFAESPFEALAILANALDNMPGEDRLVACERLLRQQLDTRISLEEIPGRKLGPEREADPPLNQKWPSVHRH